MAINPWFVSVAVVIPALMGAVGTTFVGVARPYIAGGLSAPAADDEWVMTSYLAANAFILPVSGWLAAHFGRRNYFLWSIAVFTIASGLCGLATSLPQLILFRIIQGLAAGGLQPASQAILLDSLPLEKQGAAQTMFGVAVLVGPIVGPRLSGWLVINYNWRWIFYINAPVGLLSFLTCYAFLEDPDYLRQERAELKKRPLNFDGIGLGLLALVMASWEVMLSKGQEWDWLDDPFWRVQTLLIVFVLALLGLLYRELTFASPVINFRVLQERNFAVSLRHLLRRLCRAVRIQHSVAVAASDLVRLRRLRRRRCAVAGRRFRHVYAVDCGPPPWQGHRCTLAHCSGPARHGGRQLLDGTDELVLQSVAGNLAAGSDGRRPVADVRPAQRGRLPLHPQAPARSGRGLLALLRTEGGSSARPCSRPSRSGARSSTRTSRRLSRPLESGSEFLHGTNPGLLLPLQWRPGWIATTSAPTARRPPRTAGFFICLFRRLLGGSGREFGAGVFGIIDEALGGGEKAWQEIAS